MRETLCDVVYSVLSTVVHVLPPFTLYCTDDVAISLVVNVTVAVVVLSVSVGTAIEEMVGAVTSAVSVENDASLEVAVFPDRSCDTTTK